MHMTANLDRSPSKMVRGSCDRWQAQPGDGWKIAKEGEVAAGSL